MSPPVHAIEIGLLDFGIRKKYLSSLFIIEDLIEDAIISEELGFSRLWYGEHFDPSIIIPWLNPEPFLPLICADTDRIKVGIAGTLIFNNSPIRVAANYKLLNNLFNSRIELGFAKGLPPTYQEQYFNSKFLANSSYTPALINNLIQQTVSLLRNELHFANEGIILPPVNGDIPKLWNLTTSGKGYTMSKQLGLNCSRTLFLKNVDLSPELDLLYEFKLGFAKEFGSQPNFNIVIAGSCQEDAKAVNKIISESERYFKTYNLDSFIIAEPLEFKNRILELANRYNAEEVILLEVSLEKEYRRKSLNLISSVFNLSAAKQ